MNKIYEENNLLKLIRYGAIVLILIFSFIITNIFIEEKRLDALIEIKELEDNFVNHNKILVENLVRRTNNMIALEKEIATNDLKEKLKIQINQAYDIINGIYQENIKDENYSKEQTIDLIKAALRGIRFDENLGYIFVYTLDGINILNPEFPSIENKNLWNHKDARGKLIIQEMNKILENDLDTFYTWYWKKPNDREKEYEKIGFFKKFEPYNIFIGTGAYIVDFEEKLQKRILKKLNSIKLKKPEHIFIYTKDGTCLVNPKKELIGVNRYNAQNKDGVYVLRGLLEYVHENKKGFVRYNSSVTLNNKNITNDKITYLKLFESWDWMIGSGFYMEDLDRQIEEKKNAFKISSEKTINKIILISVIATIFMIILSFYISSVTASIFKKYKEKVKSELEKSLEKEKLLIQQSKMATMGEMIGNIAHQWKQPLSIILMSNSFIKMNKNDNSIGSDEDIRDAIERIDTSTKYLSTTIDDFRNFFRPDKTKDYFFIEDTFEKTFTLMNTQFKNNNIQIIRDITHVEVYGFQNELLQVFINLFKNAKDELVKLDSGILRLVFIEIYQEEENIIIKIKDNAGGIKEEIIENIFDAYFTTKENNEGTGIGLYMSKQIIEGMEGSIKVENTKYEYENEKYVGAQFTIVLKANTNVNS